MTKKTSERRFSIFKIIFSRTMVVTLFLLIQILILFLVFQWLSVYSPYILSSFSIIGMIVVIYIINKDENPAFKLAWIVPVCIFPVFGVLLYLFLQFNLGYNTFKKAIIKSEDNTKKYLKSSPEALLHIAEDSKYMSTFVKYMEEIGMSPIYENTEITYFPLGEEKFKAMKEELEKARDFIFLEYFIIDQGIMWDSILEILARKAKEGVEVRVMYDGMCSLVLLPYHYPEQLKRMGINAKMFSPIKPLLSTHQNNRDHRKILVIDGKVAFNGGVNLADEYINQRNLFGHWKDNALMLKGEAVKSFTVMFLQLWNATETKECDFEKYLNATTPIHPTKNSKANGFVIPYGDGPTNDLDIAETVYLDIINTAQEYIHIMSPYLVLDNEFVNALIYAARRGVDVKIMIPHIPDKKIPFAVARTYYPQLLRGGVKIYEYTPGFVHAKTFISDNLKAVVGTINLDYRSLFLHFECATFLYKNVAIYEIEEDFQNTLARCQEISLDDFKKFSISSRLIGRGARFIAPLL